MIDECMEYVNGSEKIRLIRQLERENKIKPVTFFNLTSFEDKVNKHNILNAGADAVLAKPCSRKNLEEVFKRFNIINILLCYKWVFYVGNTKILKLNNVKLMR
jgi:CheY-like chemotaxis protein